MVENTRGQHSKRLSMVEAAIQTFYRSITVLIALDMKFK